MTSKPTATDCKLHPLFDRIIVRPSEADSKYGAIILPDIAREKPKRGTVIAVGPGGKDKDGLLHEVPVTIGEEVIFASYAGIEVKIGAETFLIVASKDLLATVR